MVESLTVYRHIVMARIRSQLEYRTSFVFDLFGALTSPFLDFVAVLILFTHIPAMGGWSLHEIAFLYGMTGVSFAITDLVVGHLDSFSRFIREGTFDVILLRPLGSLMQVISADFSLRRVGRIAQAVAVLLYASSGLDIHWTLGRIVMMPVTIVCGSVIFGAVWIIFASITFWSTETLEITNAFTYGGNFLTQYPLNIFGAWLRRFLAFVIPMAFVNYFPSLYLLDKPDRLNLPSVLRFMAPVVSLIVVFVARAIWRIAVRHYRSTGT